MEELTYSQFSRAETFRDLHQGTGMFVIPNPWDAGSAKMLTGLGFQALASTSAGMAYTIGEADGYVMREESLANARSIVAATHLPVTADLEDGFGENPETCAETILLAAKVGLVGGSVGDSKTHNCSEIFDLDHAVARIKAAVDAARSLPFHFTLTARSENFLHGRNDLGDTIRRLVAFADAGADVLFAPAIKTSKDIKAIVKAVAPKPVNVLWGYPDQSLTVKDLANLGVKRLSTGSSLARAAYGAFYNAAKEIRNNGTFNYAKNAIPYPEINSLLSSQDLMPGSTAHFPQIPV